MSDHQDPKKDPESIAENVKEDDGDKCDGKVGFFLPVLVPIHPQDLEY